MHDFRFKATQGAISSVTIRSLSEVLNQDFLQGLLRSAGVTDLDVITVASLMGDEAYEDRLGAVRVSPPVDGVPWERYLEPGFAALLTQHGGTNGMFRLRLMGGRIADIQVDTEVPYRDDTDRQQRPSTNRLRPVVPLGCMSPAGACSEQQGGGR